MLNAEAHRAVSRRSLRGLQSAAVAVGVSAAGWWSLLGWDHTGTYDSDGNYHGPYEAWQMISLVVVMGLLAVWLGVRGSLILGPAAAAVALPASFAVDAHSDSSGLWVIGAALLIGGTYAALSVAALIAHLIAEAHRRRVHRALMPR